MTSVGRDDSARRLKGRNPSVDRKNSEKRREGQAPPLRDGGETFPGGKSAGGHIGPPLQHLRQKQQSRRTGGSPDPPAGFRMGFIPRGGFRPAGRVSFPTMGKKPKDRRGKTHIAVGNKFPPAPVRFPPDPRLRGIPLYPHVIFPARKIWFRACTILQPRLVPTSRGRGCGSGGRWTKPFL